MATLGWGPRGFSNVGLNAPFCYAKNSMADRKLQVVPLGGLGEFGMNSMALRYGDDIIVIDAGMMFPDAELLGVCPQAAIVQPTAAAAIQRPTSGAWPSALIGPSACCRRLPR